MGKATRTVKKRIFYKLGIGLLIASTIFLITPVGLLLIQMPIKLKAKTIAGSLILAEATFWLGVLLAGKGIVNRAKDYIKFRKWRKKEVQDHDRPD